MLAVRAEVMSSLLWRPFGFCHVRPRAIIETQ